MSRRLIVLEAWSRTPSPAQLATAWLKLAWVTERWFGGDERLAQGDRAPSLLVLSNGRPRAALAAFEALEPLATVGAYGTNSAGASSALLLDLRALPPRSGLSLLRFLSFPRGPEDARERTDRLLGDEDLPIRMRRALMDAIMSDQIPIVAEEQESAYDLAVRRGIEIGERQAWITMARGYAASDIVASLERETDIAELRRRVLALIPSRSQG